VSEPKVSRKLKIVFMGTADFAVPSLHALVEARHEIAAVVTQPDKPSGRGMQMTASPVKKAAETLGLTVLQPKRVRAESFITKMRVLAPDVLAVAAFGQIIPQSLLDLPTLAPINVHGSLLPKWRGAAPIQRAIMAGDSEIGVTTMWMDATLDTGDMLLEDGFPVAPDDTAGSLFARLAELGAGLLIQTIDGLAAGTLERRPQEDSQATYAPMIAPEDSVLDWNETASQIDCRIRGLSPRPGVFASFRSKRLKVWRAVPQSETPTDAAPGTVLELRPDGVLTAAGSGTTALLTEVQPDSGKRMTGADWARGVRLTAGETFKAS
jgi:methionyl-tRNA formyltransferase